MSTLQLVQPVVTPIQPGDEVRVPSPVRCPCGRYIRTGWYTVLRVEGRRLLIETPLDCSRIEKRYHMPTPEERRAGAPIPFAAEPKRVWLDPGEYTAYAEGDGPADLPDHPLQTS